jgi:hypothetical protein
MAAWAKLAEDKGFDSVWVNESVYGVPSRQRKASTTMMTPEVFACLVVEPLPQA